MNILYYGGSTNKDYMSAWQRYHFYDELSHRSCIISDFNVKVKENENETIERLKQEIDKNGYELFMTTALSHQIHLSVFEVLREKGIPSVLLCMDNLSNPYDYKEYGKQYDLLWLFMKGNEYMFDKWGIKNIFLPFAANPYFLIPHYEQEEELAVGFIGNPHGSRKYRINTLISSHIPVSIYTGGLNQEANNVENKGEKRTVKKAETTNMMNSLAMWMRYREGRRLATGAVKNKLSRNRKLITDSDYCVIKPSVSMESLGEYYGKFALSLSFTEAYSTASLRYPLYNNTLRNFEIPMSGGVQFTRYSDEMASYFKEDKEIIFFRNNQEMMEKAKFYLDEKHKGNRLKIRNAARERAEAEHTWTHRFSKLFSVLGLRSLI